MKQHITNFLVHMFDRWTLELWFLLFLFLSVSFHNVPYVGPLLWIVTATLFYMLIFID